MTGVYVVAALVAVLIVFGVYALSKAAHDADERLEHLDDEHSVDVPGGVLRHPTASREQLDKVARRYADAIDRDEPTLPYGGGWG